MYCTINFKTKKALKEAVAAGWEVGIYQAGLFGGNEPRSGVVAVKGPWAPQPHTWYAEVTLVEGTITRVK